MANADHCLVVFAADRPAFAAGPATRFLISAQAAGLPVTLVLNKADLVAPEELAALVEEVCVRARVWVVLDGEGGCVCV